MTDNINTKNKQFSVAINLKQKQSAELKLYRCNVEGQTGNIYRFYGTRHKLTFAAVSATGASQAYVRITLNNGTSCAFKLCDINRRYPIFAPNLGIAVTSAEDERSYAEIVEDITDANLKTNLQSYEQHKQLTYKQARKKFFCSDCPTFLTVPHNVHIWEAGFRGYPIEEKQHYSLYDYFIPRMNWIRRDYKDSDAERVVYNYFMGKGMGSSTDIKRFLLDGCLPILNTCLKEDGIEYHMQCFADMQDTDKYDSSGTNYLIADYYSAGHVLTDEQKHALSKLPKDRGQNTLLRLKFTFKNTGTAPDYAYIRLPHINTPVMAEADSLLQAFDVESGLGTLGGKVYMQVSPCMGEGIERAYLIMPGEQTEIYIVLHHYLQQGKITPDNGKEIYNMRLKAVKKYWRQKLGTMSHFTLPNKELQDAVKTGYLNLLAACYGEKEGSVFAPCAGVYSPIGSESSPIIQFLDSAGCNDMAGKCLNFFYAKQHSNGFMQNMTNYMLENGAVLYTSGLHYLYTKDEVWLSRNIEGIKKAAEYLLAWIERNSGGNDRGDGLIDGQIADPVDKYRLYCLNAYAYAGLKAAANMLAQKDDAHAQRYLQVAAALKNNILSAFKQSLQRAVLGPLKNGEWAPLLPPWPENTAPASLHLYGEEVFTHGGHVLKDSLLSVAWAVYLGVIDFDSELSDIIVNTQSDLYLNNHAGISQPMYNIVPLLNLKRGEINSFIKEYYTSLCSLSDRETYSFWEHYFLATPNKTHEQAWFLMRTRYMLYYEGGERDLFIFFGVPDDMKKNGARIAFSNMRCLYGELSVASHVQKGLIKIDIKCNWNDKKPVNAYIKLPVKNANGYIFEQKSCKNGIINISLAGGKREIVIKEGVLCDLSGLNSTLCPV